jgi:hypothetical protein
MYGGVGGVGANRPRVIHRPSQQMIGSFGLCSENGNLGQSPARLPKGRPSDADFNNFPTPIMHTSCCCCCEGAASTKNDDKAGIGVATSTDHATLW